MQSDSLCACVPIRLGGAGGQGLGCILLVTPRIIPDGGQDWGRFWNGSRTKGAERTQGMPCAKYLQDSLVVWPLCTLSSLNSRKRLPREWVGLETLSTEAIPVNKLTTLDSPRPPMILRVGVERVGCRKSTMSAGGISSPASLVSWKRT